MPYFTDEGIEAQRGEVIPPGSHSQEVAESGFETRATCLHRTCK